MGIRAGTFSKGLPSGFIGTVTNAHYGVWMTDQRGATLAVHLWIRPDQDSGLAPDEKSINPAYYSLGQAAFGYFRPSIDDQTPLFGWRDEDGNEHEGSMDIDDVKETYGQYLVPIAPGKGKELSGSCGWADFYNNLMEAGFGEDHDDNSLHFLVGMKARWERVQMMDRPGIPDYKPGDILVPREILEMPPKGGGNPADYGWDGPGQDTSEVPATGAEAEKAAASGASKKRRRSAAKSSAASDKKRRGKKAAKKDVPPLEERVEAAILELCKTNDGESDLKRTMELLAKQFEGAETFKVVELVTDNDYAWSLADERTFGYDVEDKVFFIPE